MNFQALEDARIKIAKKIKIIIYIGLALFILAVILAAAGVIGANRSAYQGFNIVSMFITMGVAGVFIAVILSIIALIFTYKDYKTYKKLYKAYFVERSLRETFTDLQYNHEQGMPKAILTSTGMIRTGDIYHSNDFTSGKYKDVAFSQADVNIQEEYTDSDGHTQYNTIFRGRWMVFEFPKPFTFRLQVVEKWFTASKKPQKNHDTKRKIERIHTESITFDKKFKVYAEDGFEAYYILDPAFIDHIEKLEATHQGKLMLCFINNQLHVGIHDNKDAFEPPNPLKRLDEQAEFAKIHQDIKAITDYVDFLKLDRKLFEGNNK